MGHQVTRTRELVETLHKGTMRLHLEAWSSLYSKLLDYPILVKFGILAMAEAYLDYISSAFTTIEPQTSESMTNLVGKEAILAMLQS